MIFSNKIIGTCAYLGGLPAILEEFAWSWGQMIAYNYEYVITPGESIYYNKARASIHYFARNSLVDSMMGDWLFQLDTDLSFDPDILGRLLFLMNRYDIGVLSGVYTFKTKPHPPVLYTYDGKIFRPLVHWEGQADIFEVGGAGAGCLLVKKWVFDKIKQELNESPFDINGTLGEDLAFFQRLHKLGIKAYCAPNIEVNHLLIYPTSLADRDLEYITVSNKFEVGGFK